MRNRRKVNYLDFVPRKNMNNSSFTNEKGNCVIKIENVGAFNKMAQIILKKPRYSYIELEEFGTYIWEYIDGKNTIYDIAQKVSERFGKDAEPLYERICKYFTAMENVKLIVLEYQMTNN